MQWSGFCEWGRDQTYFERCSRISELYCAGHVGSQGVITAIVQFSGSLDERWAVGERARAAVQRFEVF